MPETIDSPRSKGLVKNEKGLFIQCAEKYTIHRKKMSFGELCRKIIKPETRYLVLDLDGTFHKGLNLGVYLGWELTAAQSYGTDYLLKSEKRRGKRLVALRPEAPFSQLKYAFTGLRLWGAPGLVYYSCARLGWKNQSFRKILKKLLGPSAMDELLGLMRLGLLHQMSGFDLSEVIELSRSLWRRYRGLQVIEPEDIVKLRQDFPDLKIIVSSASPKACLEIVKEKFPVHDIIYTDIETRNNKTSSPHLPHPGFMGRPKGRIAPPNSLSHNASHLKIKNLVERYPDFLSVHTVGITDTKHGEDHSWAEYFKCVAAINSPDPFSPFLSAKSPLQEIHAADVLTFEEKSKTIKNPQNDKTLVLHKNELEKILKNELKRAGMLAEEAYEEYARIEGHLKIYEKLEKKLENILEHAIHNYNRQNGRKQKIATNELYEALCKYHYSGWGKNRIQRPLSMKLSALEQVEERAVNKIFSGVCAS